jgi:small subunit ribosomal protein S6
MRPYEIVVILDAGLEEDAIRQSVDRATDLITSRGGTVGRIDRWGKRRFAYEVHHRWEGYYVLIQASTEPAVVAELDRMLHLADEVIRHKVIRLPEAAVGQGARPTPPPQPAAVGAEADTNANGA